MIVIIDYGLGNLASILNMCKRLGIEARISNRESDIEQAEKLILPGVGHFRRGMENLQASGMKDVLHDVVLVGKKPILGICLGAQLMTMHSEEGNVDGLGWVDATTVGFDTSKIEGRKIPHMGWTEILNLKAEHMLWKGLTEDPRFYFVHSYHFLFDSPIYVTALANYGYNFACAFQKGNIFGVQFHPEKSHKYGMSVLTNFAKVQHG